jgi:hypothetical protein
MRAAVTAALLFLAIAPAILVATAYLENFSSPDSVLRPFTDANTYLAAGERLNDGHDLYRLRPGDRSVDIFEKLYAVPLVGPPMLAVLWRPLAAVDAGFVIWVALCWGALLGAMAYLVIRVGLLAAIACVALCIPIGEQLAVANVSSLFPAMLIAAWRTLGTGVSGVVIGFVATAKLAPIVLVNWLIGRRDWHGVVAASVTVVVLSGVTLIGAGLENVLAFRVAIADVKPSPFSVSSLTGIPYATYAVLVVGSVFTLATRRWSGVSFGIAVTTATIGTPALYVAALVPLLAVLSPLTDSSAPAWARFLALSDAT